jgi:hypothetical protein
MLQDLVCLLYNPCRTPLDSAPLTCSLVSTSFQPTRPYVSSSDPLTHSHPSSRLSTLLFDVSACPVTASGSSASTAACKNSETGLTIHRCCGYPVFLGSLPGRTANGPSNHPRCPPEGVTARTTCEEAWTSSMGNERPSMIGSSNALIARRGL